MRYQIFDWHSIADRVLCESIKRSSRPKLASFDANEHYVRFDWIAVRIVRYPKIDSSAIDIESFGELVN